MTAFLCLISSFLHVIISHAYIHPEPRIINGIPSRVSQFPFIAVIRLLQYDSNNTTYASEAYCGASLLRKEYPAAFLSGSLCVFNNTDDLILQVLASNTDQPPIIGLTGWPVISYIVHEQFDSFSLNNDIALLFIDADLTTRNDLETVSISNLINPSSSPLPCCSNTDILQAIGYGYTSFGGMYSDTLEYTNLNYIGNVRCNQILCEYETGDIDCRYIYATNNNICGLGNYSTACHGDSGGPLIKFGTNEQVGIISGGIDCISWLPAVFTNTGVYYKWIHEKLDQYQGIDIKWPIYPWTPTFATSTHPTNTPSDYPSNDPTKYPSDVPTFYPTNAPTKYPSTDPTNHPSTDPTNYPSSDPTDYPSTDPTNHPSTDPTNYPSSPPTNYPSSDPTDYPSIQPTDAPTRYPTDYPTLRPTKTDFPSRISQTSAFPTDAPTPTDFPSINPTETQITDSPSAIATTIPTSNPTTSPVVKETFSTTELDDAFNNIPVASSLSQDTELGLTNFETIIYGLVTAFIIICIIMLILIVYIPYKHCTKTTKGQYETVRSETKTDTNEKGDIEGDHDGMKGDIEGDHDGMMGDMVDDITTNSPEILYIDHVFRLEPILESPILESPILESTISNIKRQGTI